MRTHAKHLVSFLAFGTIVALLIAGCNMFGSGTGTMKLSLTDAPIDDTSVTGVYIKPSMRLSTIPTTRDGSR